MGEKTSKDLTCGVTGRIVWSHLCLSFFTKIFNPISALFFSVNFHQSAKMFFKKKIVSIFPVFGKEICQILKKYCENACLKLF